MGIESVKNNTASYVRTAEPVEVRTEAAAAEAAAQQSMSDSIAAGKVSESQEKGAQNGKEDADALAQQAATNATIKKVVEEINKKAHNSEAIFGIHEETNRVTIKIVDKESKEVIKEYPPEKTLDMIAKVWEMAGLMVDEKR